MNSDRIKEIQETTTYPESVSVMLALKQVWNECEQEQVKNLNIPVVSNRREQLIAFLDWLESNSDNCVDRGWIDDYLKAINCC